MVVGAGIIGAACSLLPGPRRAAGRRGRARHRSRPARPARARATSWSPTRSPAPSWSWPCCRAGCGRSSADELGPAAELEPKGGLVVAAGPAERAGLDRFAAAQAGAGVEIEPVGPDGLRELEPHLADGLAGGVRYPQDMQVQPMIAAARLLRRARELGAELLFRQEVTGLETAGGPGDGRADGPRRAQRRARGQRGRPVGGRTGRPGRRPPAGPAAPRVHRRDRGAARPDPAQGLHRRLRGQRGQRLGRAGDLHRGRGHGQRHRADRGQPRAGRLRPHLVAARRRPAGRPGRRAVPGPGRGARHPLLPRLPALLPRPPARDRRRRPPGRAAARLRPRGRRASGWPRPPVT